MGEGLVWKDETSYSQGDTVRIPRVWELKVGNIDVTVHRYAGLEGWFVSSRYLKIDTRGLTSSDVEGAKHEALSFVHDLIKKKTKEIEELKWSQFAISELL